jgi:hypothetical protein
LLALVMQRKTSSFHLALSGSPSDSPTYGF